MSFWVLSEAFLVKKKKNNKKFHDLPIQWDEFTK